MSTIISNIRKLLEMSLPQFSRYREIVIFPIKLFSDSTYFDDYKFNVKSLKNKHTKMINKVRDSCLGWWGVSTGDFSIDLYAKI